MAKRNAPLRLIVGIWGVVLIGALGRLEAFAASDDNHSAPTSDFTRVEAFELFPGGEATSRKRVNKNSFSHPSANMSFERRLDFMVGNGFFRKVWVSAPASTQASDGLGPLYNARSCQRCHLKDGRGHPPAGNWPEDTAVSMLVRLSVPPQTDADREALASHREATIPEPVYGGQLQDFGIQGVPAEGRIHIEYDEVPVELTGGETVQLRKPRYSISDLKYGPLHPDAMISPRVAPPMIGLGLLEMVPEQAILKAADPEDSDGDGISGRPSLVWDKMAGEAVLGRFGWKAGEPTILQQLSHAFSGDMGISTPLAPAGYGDCSERQAACRAAPQGGDPQYEGLEAPSKVVATVLFYSRNLAVPARRRPGDPEILLGKKLFYGAGCTSCHTPKFVTGEDPARPELSGQLIWPYSDLLLHDMGEELADGRPDGVASGKEWRTAPLWGIGLTKVVNGHTQFLHDGRARSLTEAILWHGGEAAAARQAFRAMSRDQRADLISFLESL